MAALFLAERARTGMRNGTRRPYRKPARPQWTRWQNERQFWIDYNLYLMSQEWDTKRTLVLHRARFLCEVCHRREAAHVHHLSYFHVFNEPLADLQAVCLPCHERIHQRPLH